MMSFNRTTKFRFTKRQSWKYGCEKIFTDHLSGSKKDRPGLKSAIEFSRPGDTIVVWRLD